jgi:hypothetical protein
MLNRTHANLQQRTEIMNRLRMTLAILCSASILWSVNGATIFSDDFSDTTKSKINWVTLASNFSMTFSGGALTLKNSDATYTDFLIRTLTTKPSTFTLSVKFTITDPKVNGAGLICCLNTASGVKGYTVQLGTSQSQYLYASKNLGTSPSVPLWSKSSSFFQPVTNTITISKNASTFNVFCNGNFVKTFNDAQFSSGDFAILVPPKFSIVIDDVVMTDQFLAGNPAVCYQDSFTITEPDGWNLGMLQGELTVGGGQIVLNNTDTNYSSIIFTEGNFQNATMRAQVSYKSGQGSYGLTFIMTADTGKTHKTYAFLIDAQRRYSFVHPDSANGLVGPPLSSIFGSLGTDTMEVRHLGSGFSLFTNGVQVGDTFPNVSSKYVIDGAGLFVSKKTNAACNYFKVGGDSTGPVCTPQSSVINHYVPIKTSIPGFGCSSIIYDIRGRKIGTWNRLTFNKMIAGPYIIVTKSPAGAVVKAVRVMKLPK